jgi:geranylgeranyl diphosphate synthase type II
LNKYLDVIEEHLSNFQFGDEPAELYEPIKYILSLGGKRLRPVLTLMACQLFDKDFSKAIYPALGVEVFHNFTLLHDDIMDNAPMRRGKKTVHEKWNENVAILSGDVMLVKAYDLFLKSAHPDISTIIGKFNKCASEVCEGQQYDMNFERRDTVSEEEYLNMIRLKTAVLLGFAVELGAIIGGADRATSEKLCTFGANIGIGFQLKDDLLDIYASAEKFGKQTGGDIISNKKTFLLIKALELSQGDDKKKLDLWLNKQDFDPQEKVREVVSIYDNLGIKALTEEKMNEFLDAGLKMLDSLPIENERMKPLKDLTLQLIDREK